MALYPGNTRSHGNYNPRTDKGFTNKDPLERAEFAKHLYGSMGVGLVPIQDDDTCTWGVIDVDVHGPDAYNTTPEQVAADITRLDLPLIPCRTKRGGIHCCAFLSKQHPAAYVRGLLKKWAIQLGFPKSEIFPKQDKMIPEALGSWLNLPYLNADDTTRYALIGGEKASLESFIKAAETLKADQYVSAPKNGSNGASPASANAATVKFNFKQAPPCVRKIFEEHAGENQRNNSLWMAAVWLKRQHPDDWKDMMLRFNDQAFARPLDAGEIKKIQGSVTKRDYAYKCKDEPCLSLCEKDLCKKLKFGVRMGTDYTNLPVVDKLVKIASDPPKWIVHIYEAEIPMSTRQLATAYEFCLRVLDKTNKLLPIAKADEWAMFVQDLLETKLETIGVEQGVGHNDAFSSAFAQFIRDAQTDKQEPDELQRRRYIRDTGAAVITLAGMPRVVFRVSVLEQRLRTQFNMRISGEDVFANLKLSGAESTKASFAGARIGVWSVPYEPVVEDNVTSAFKPEY